MKTFILGLRLRIFNEYWYSWKTRELLLWLGRSMTYRQQVRLAEFVARNFKNLLPDSANFIHDNIAHVTRWNHVTTAAMANKVVRYVLVHHVNTVATNHLTDKQFDQLGKQMRFNGKMYWEKAFITAANRPIMFATMHFGNLLTLIRGLAVSSNGRPMYVLLNKDAPGVFYDRTLARIKGTGHDVRVIDITVRQHMRAFFKAAKEGPITFVLFGDLYGKFGFTNNVRFFGHNARFAGGGMRLAEQINAMLLPCHTTGSLLDNTATIEFMPCIDFANAPAGEDKAQWAHQQFIYQLEQAIAKFGDQWHFWEAAGYYFQPAPLLSARHNTKNSDSHLMMSEGIS